MFIAGIILGLVVCVGVFLYAHRNDSVANTVQDAVDPAASNVSAQAEVAPPTDTNV